MADKSVMNNSPFKSESEEKEAESTVNPLEAFFEKSEQPWEDVSLPSKGLYYGGSMWSDVELPGGIIQVRPWTINEEKILNTTRYVKSNKALDMIFERVCKFPEGFTANDLLIGDRLFLLFYFRGISYGNEYEFSVRCTNEDCQKMSTHTYDLNNLASGIRYANEDLGPEPFMVDLPNATKKAGGRIYVEIKFSRQSDVKSLMRMQNQKKMVGDTSQTDESIAQEMIQNIISVNGNKDRAMISKFVDNMSALDASVIREFLRKNSPGIEPKINISCPHCDNEMEMELPITETFFRYTGTSSN